MTIPSRVGELLMVQGGLKYMELPVRLDSFDVRMHQHTRHRENPAIQWFCAQIRETIA